MVTTPEIHLLRLPPVQHRPRTPSISIATHFLLPPTLRYGHLGRPPPCKEGRLFKTAELLVGQSPQPLYVPAYIFAPSLPCNGPAYHMADRLSSTKFEDSEFEYLFVAMRLS